jgi:hypothetical protein
MKQELFTLRGHLGSSLVLLMWSVLLTGFLPSFSVDVVCVANLIIIWVPPLFC